MPVSVVIDGFVRTKVESVVYVHFNSLLSREDLSDNNKTFLRSHILEEIFGNIAIYGASENTDFPNLDISTQLAEVWIEEEDGESEKKVKHTVDVSYNINKISTAIKLVPAMSDKPFMKKMTFRNLCSPFANEAYRYLKRCAADNVYTELYKKMPDLCKSAPWVAFDFNRGLDFKSLSHSEKKLIQNLNRRLFTTSIKTNEAEATEDSKLGELAV